MANFYDGSDVQTTGPDRHALIAGVWAKLEWPRSAATVEFLGLAPTIRVLGWSDSAGSNPVQWGRLSTDERKQLASTTDQRVTWTAQWGVENRAQGQSDDLAGARAAARAAYGANADGALVTICVDDVAIFAERYNATGRRWIDQRLGEREAHEAHRRAAR